MGATWKAIRTEVWAFFLLAVVLGCGGNSDPVSSEPIAQEPVTGGQLFASGLADPLAPTPEEAAGLSEEVKRRLLERREKLMRLTTDSASSVPQLAEANGELGMIYHAYKLFRLADICYTRATRAAPDDFRWWYYLGKVKQSRLLLEASRACFERALQIDPDQAPLLIELGEIYRKDTELERAKAMFGKALELRADCAPAMVGLAQIANLEKRHADALMLAQKALDLQPHSSIPRYIAGLASRGLGDLEKAEAYLEPREGATEGLVFQDPWMERVKGLGSHAKQIFEAGNRAMAQGRLDAGLEAFRQALEEEPQNPAFRSKLAWALLKKGDKAGALHEYRILARDRPGNSGVHYNMGGLLLEMGRPAEAATAFQKVVELDPDNIEVSLYLADALRIAGRHQEALEQYQKVVTERPNLTGARIGRALMALRLEQFQAALAYLEEDVEAVPGAAFFRLARARVLATSPVEAIRDPARAYSLARPVPGAEPRREGLETLAMAAANMGRFEEAVSLQERALRLSPPGDPHRAIAAQRAEGYKARRAPRRPWEWDERIFSVPSYARR